MKSLIRFTAFFDPSDCELVRRNALRVEYERPRLVGGTAVTQMSVVCRDPPAGALAPALARARECSAFSYVEFDTSEIDDARFCQLVPGWLNGYPEPRPDDFGFREVTYDPGTGCRTCGVGARQVSPFRLRRPPKWGRRSFMQLNWVFGEHFTNADTFEQVFADLGVGRREVLDKAGAVIHSIFQLMPQAEVDIDPARLAGTWCGVCGETKYLPYVLGYFPPIVNPPPNAHVLRPRQWFGSGGEARQELLVSRTVVARLRTRKARGVSFHPVDDGSHGPARKDTRQEARAKVPAVTGSDI